MEGKKKRIEIPHNASNNTSRTNSKIQNYETEPQKRPSALSSTIRALKK